MPTQAEPRYRVSLTAKQISTVMAKIITPEALKDEDIQSLLIAFAPVNLKISTGSILPSYMPVIKYGIEDTLGMGSKLTDKDDMSFGTTLNFGSKELYWEWCYNKMIATPDSCTTGQVEAAAEHKYLTGLMTPAEEAEFEAED